MNLKYMNGVTVVRWHGRARGAFAPSLTFLLLFCQEKSKYQ